MKKTRRVEILFSDNEYRRLYAAKRDKSISDYIRSLIQKDCEQDSKEGNEFNELLQKLRLADLEKLYEKMQKIELAVLSLSHRGNENQSSETGHSNNAQSGDNRIRIIATVLAANARAVPGESKIFGEFIDDDFTVKRPLDFIFSYLRFFSEQRPYAITHLKRIYPDLFKVKGWSGGDN
jgi:hypothetical protein